MSKRPMNRLVKAYENGTGLRLNAEDVKEFVNGDIAIYDAVINRIAEDEERDQAEALEQKQ